MKKTLLTLFSLLMLGSAIAATTNTTTPQASFLDNPKAQAFINKMVNEHGFPKEQLTTLIGNVPERPTVMKSIKRPTEKNPWLIYQRLFITEQRIAAGKTFWKTHQELLNKVQNTYHIPADIMVATLGVETNYFKQQGDYPVIDALVNIAFNYPARSKFFTYQLEQFLLLCRDEHLDPTKVLGSYAGAIGAPQFMPDSYRKYAVDFDGDGKIDLNHNEADVIGSIANYYKEHGWITGGQVAIEATYTGKAPLMLETNNRLKLYTPEQLTKAGIVPATAIPKDEKKIMLMALDTKDGTQYWLGLHNFQVILRYNSSYLYGMAVYELGQKVSPN